MVQLDDTWRLETETIIYQAGNSIWLASPGKKSYQSVVIKKINGDYTENRIPEAKFKARIVDTGIIELQLNSSDKWYTLENYQKSSIWELVSSNNLKTGVIEEEVEPVFSDIYPGYVSLVTSKMQSYSECVEEFTRRINCDLYKKTKKWIPGHRYDSTKETIYYLGSFTSRRDSEYISEFKDTPVECYLYVSRLKPEWKSISDVFTNSTFDNDKFGIKVTYSIQNMVDSGEKLTNDVSGIGDYFDYLYKNTTDNSVVNRRYGKPIEYKSHKHIFDVFCYQDKDHINTENETTVLRKLIYDTVNDCMFINWNYRLGDTENSVDSQKTLEENVKNLDKLYFSYLIDGNVYKEVYYRQLFKNYNINFTSILEDVVSVWLTNNGPKINNFEDYYNNHYYYYAREKRVNVYQRVNSTPYQSSNITTIKDSFGDNELTNLLIEMLYDSVKNYGVDINLYSESKSKGCSDICVNCNISLNDVVKYKKGIENLSESLKNIIMNKKFTGFSISFDKNTKNLE